MAFCDKHGIEKRTIAGGVSKKTGKAYNAFDVCDMCNLEKNAPTSAQPFINPVPSKSFQEKGTAIASAMEEKGKSIEKMHETKMKAECLHAAAIICAVTKATDYEQVIETANSYHKWLKDNGEPPF